MKPPRGLKERLEEVFSTFSREDHVRSDPVFFPRWFCDRDRDSREIEGVALFSAMLAYGKVELFMAKIEHLLKECNYSFLDLAAGKIKILNWPAYRLSDSKEIATFVRAIGKVIQDSGSLKQAFDMGWNASGDIKSGLISLRKAIIDAIRISPNQISPGLLHLIPNPELGGACKRWNMFLRWMVRPNDGIDLGLWKDVPTSKLIIPLDRHISQISRNLGFTSRMTDNWKTAQEITDSLKTFDSSDPVRYDFSLCHLGVSKNCSHGRNRELCKKCFLLGFCRKAGNELLQSEEKEKA